MTSTDISPFTLRLPDGFVDLPLGELTGPAFGALAQDVAALFGQREIDASITLATATLAEYAKAATDEGAVYAAAGIYTSLDRTRPVMVRVRCLQVANEPVEGDEILLPSGPATLVRSSSTVRIPIGGGEADLETLSIAVVSPAPDRSFALAVVVSSNNVEDWPQIEDLALGLFDAFSWNQTR